MPFEVYKTFNRGLNNFRNYIQKVVKIELY